jgi:hypothetical protein
MGMLNWDAIAAIGELVGASAVFVSIIYLALQVLQNSTDVRSSGAQNAAHSAIQILESLGTNSETRDVFQRALDPYSELDRDEQAVAKTFFLEIIAYYETCYYQYLDGVVHQEIWEGRRRMMLDYFESPGFSSWWDDWNHVWGASFQKYVAEQRASPGERRVTF